MIGRTISHYKITEELGKGGMGVLYRARDIHLDRMVAIKVLRPEAVDREDRRRRFVQEAKAASALNHPNIITIYDIDRIPEGDQDFIAMEYVDGKSLDELTRDHGLPIQDVLTYAVQIADALSAAHQAGIVHRDIKPANVMVTAGGRIKVLDFGLAKLMLREVLDTEMPTLTQAPRTARGVVMGTPAYMSPEQAVGDPMDARSDVFSFGCVLYEMLTGNRPFRGDSLLSTMKAIIQETPPPVTSFRADVPSSLDRVVSRCLEKQPASRFPSAGELHQELVACQRRLVASQLGMKSVLRRPIVAVPLILVLLCVGASGTWWAVQRSRVRWARNAALPQMARLLDEGDIAGALILAKQARRYIPDDPEFRRLWEDVAIPVSIETTPPGADVYMKGYGAVHAEWEWLGRSPIKEIEIPKWAYLRWKIVKEGYQTRELGANPYNVFSIHLDALETVPEGMIRVTGGSFAPFDAPVVELGDYWLDKYEVTNLQFQRFVDAGGYREQKYWKHAFIKDGEVISWSQAMAGFLDATGRPGPSTWEGGTYREDQGDFPVTGVSWYEAAAYAAFVGKELPTVYHWYYAAGGHGTQTEWVSDILNLSNFGGEGPARVGTYEGMAPYGSYDMAGNAKEWCWNRADDERRYLLGGAWNEPRYMFSESEAQSPFDRSDTYGFRLAKYSTPLLKDETGEDAPIVARAQPVSRTDRDYSKAKSVSDEVFDHFRRLYAYDRVELNPAVDSVDDSYEHWRKETVSFGAAYADVRVPAFLFLPRNTSPPYQTVVYFPEGDARAVKSSRDLWMRAVDYIIRSGRAVMYPVYQGTYERRDEFQMHGPRSVLDLKIHWYQDLSCSIDYLETRKDIDSKRLAYLGLSMGAGIAPIMLAMEHRFKAAVLVAGGLIGQGGAPETDALNFAPRAHVPLLMVNGRYDFDSPLETRQIPLFRLWGAPDEQKRHAVFESGHIPPRYETIREVLAWLDQYLGPVETRRGR